MSELATCRVRKRGFVQGPAIPLTGAGTGSVAVGVTGGSAVGIGADGSCTVGRVGGSAGSTTGGTVFSTATPLGVVGAGAVPPVPDGVRESVGLAASSVSAGKSVGSLADVGARVGDADAFADFWVRGL